ncbi:MAG: hypothetical protein DRN14_04480, partial [Thermoplasmata archaeon]
GALGNISKKLDKRDTERIKFHAQTINFSGVLLLDTMSGYCLEYDLLIHEKRIEVMEKLHPDLGGSVEAMQELNEWRDTELRELEL